MSLFRRRTGSGYDRRTALTARPEAVRVARREMQVDGRLLITVERASPGWLRLLGGRERVEHTMRLDALGIEVYEACDGKRPVADIVRDFARRHRISEAEAEISVTAFLKTLVAKGLIVMALDRKSLRKSG